MDTQKTIGAKLPIRDILWSNPDWFRAEFEEPDALVKSIKESGLQVPVLLTSDLLVIDGARRIMAYVAMGRKEIPVRITNDWDEVVEHLAQTREAEASGLPFQRMSWEEMDTLWRVAVTPLYGPKRVERGLATRKARQQGEDVEPTTIHGINIDLGRAFGVDEAHVKGVRDIFSCLRGIREDLKPTAAQLKPLVALIQSVEASNPNGTFSGLFRVRNVLRAVARGEMSFDDAAEEINEQERRRNRPRNQVIDWETRRRIHAPTESDIMRNFCSVVEQYGEQAQRLSPGEDLDAVALAQQLRTAVNRFNALRRRLLESGTDTQKEQEDG